MQNVASLCNRVGLPAPAKRKGTYTSGHVSSLMHTSVHAPRNIISRNIVSHIDVMTLGRYVDYTVGKQQPADWVSILPYITPRHSSLCFIFIALIFPNHFPGFLREVLNHAMIVGRHKKRHEGKAEKKNKPLEQMVLSGDGTKPRPKCWLVGR